MVSEEFSPRNFRYIFDEANRAGQDIGGNLFPTLREYTDIIKRLGKENRDARALFKTAPSEGNRATVDELSAKLKEYKGIWSAEVDKLLSDTAEKVARSTFRLQVRQCGLVRGKSVYSSDASAEAYFAIKQIQRSIHRAYKVRQGNRHEITRQVEQVIGCRFPIVVVRADVSSFYESIDRNRLMLKLDRDKLLTVKARGLVRGVLSEYGRLSGNDVGIPRGLGFSAYLAEIYLRPLDLEMRSLGGLIYYARYVDDILAVFTCGARTNSTVEDLESVKRVIAKHGLCHNPIKTKSVLVNDPDTTCVAASFEYLGYSYERRRVNGQAGYSTNVALSDDKERKYTERVKLIIGKYREEKRIDQKRAWRDLVARIKYVTGNTRLSGAKSGVVIGVYYSNPIVSSRAAFDNVDAVLRAELASLYLPKLERRLRRVTFGDGFMKRRFHKFSSDQIERVTRAWKNA